MEFKKKITEEEINYSDLLEKARNYVNDSNYTESDYYLNLALLAPNLDKNTKINIYSLKSYIHSKLKNEILLSNCVYKALRYLYQNKKLNDADIGFCLAKILYRGAKMYYPEIRQFNYLSCYFLYTAKLLFENLGIVNERKNQDIIEEEFSNTLKEIIEEVLKLYSNLLLYIS